MGTNSNGIRSPISNNFFFPIFILMIIAAGLVYAYQRWEEKQSFKKNKWENGIRKSFQETMAKRYPN